MTDEAAESSTRERSSSAAPKEGSFPNLEGSGDRFRVLALHGGGIHGVATAVYLRDLEERSGSRAKEHFDLVVGTSTGGIMALALSLGIPARKLETLYRERGDEIFRRRRPLIPQTIAQFFGPLYDNDPLCQLLIETLGPDTQIDDAECRLCIPAVNITAGRNVVFKTRHRPGYERDHALKMWRVAAATAAAPAYFPPVEIPGRGWFVDGGLWANAPIEVGIAEARQLGHSLDQIEVLSIGTGQKAFHRDGSPHRIFGSGRHGIFGWGKDLVDLVMRSQSQRSRNLAQYLLPESQTTHVDFPLHDDAGGLDAIEEVDTFANRALTKAKMNGQDIRERFFQSEAASDG